MGLKLDAGVNPIPVKYEDSKLCYKICGVERSIEIPAIHRYRFEEQCNHFYGDGIVAYLSNGQEMLVLRVDGTGCICTKQFKYQIGSFAWKGFNEGILNSYGGGLLEYKKTQYNVMVTNINNTDEYILSIDAPVTFRFRGSDNREYTQLFKTLPDYSRLILDEKELILLDSSNRPYKTLKGELSINKGIVMLGGVSFGS